MVLNKRLATLLVCAIVLVIGAASATMAYFTDKDSAVNTFTVGKVDISLMEYQTEKNAEGKEVIKETTLTGFDYTLIPGNEYSKNPIVKVEAGSEPCWLFVTVDNQLKDVNGKNIEGEPTIESQMVANSWKKIDTIVVDGKTLDVFAKTGLGTAGTDYKVFSTFTIKGPNTTNADIAACDDKEIKITAYAVQAQGFDTALAAWDATFGK